MPSKRISRRILRDKGFQKHKYCETKMKSSQKDVSVEGEPTKRFLQAWVWKREAKYDSRYASLSFLILVISNFSPTSFLNYLSVFFPFLLSLDRTKSAL